MGTAVFIALWIAVIVGAFFVFIVRPQKRRVMAHQALVDSVEPGDQIITTGGVIGEIETIEESTMRLRVADGVVITVARGAIAHRIPEDEPDAPEPVASEEPEAESAQ